MEDSEMASVLKTIQELWHVYKSTAGFAPCFNKMTITSADSKKIVTEFTVTQEMSNFAGNLHGGATATIADMVSTLGVLCAEGNTRPGVSVNLSMNYLRAAPIGEDVIVESINTKVGKTMAYLDIILKKKSTGDVIATGSHVKHLG